MKRYQNEARSISTRIMSQGPGLERFLARMCARITFVGGLPSGSKNETIGRHPNLRGSREAIKEVDGPELVQTSSSKLVNGNVGKPITCRTVQQYSGS